MRKFLSIMLIFVLSLSMALPCFAAEREKPTYDFEGKDLDTILSEYMEGTRLNENNFAFGFYDTRSGESYYYNENKFIIGGSMYKLPLCMTYIKLFDEGKYTPQDLVGGCTLESLIDRAITFSDNDAADTLRRHLGMGHIAYRELLLQFCDVAPEEADNSFYTVNGLSPRIMLGTLKTLYENSEFYARIIEDMKNAHPEKYFRKYQGEYEIAHKYGYMDGACNDCGIVYTPNPFIIVALTQNVNYNETILGELCEMMTAYSLYLDEKDEEARLAEEERIAAEQKAEEERLAAEKAEAERLAAEKAEQARLEAERLAAEEAAREAEQAQLSQQRIITLTVSIGIGAIVLFAVIVTAILKLRKKEKTSV